MRILHLIYPRGTCSHRTELEPALIPRRTFPKDLLSLELPEMPQEYLDLREKGIQPAGKKPASPKAGAKGAQSAAKSKKGKGKKK